MTEQLIRQVAERTGCAVLKRVTEGCGNKHFATFELDGEHDALRAAWELLRPHARGYAFDSIRAVNNPDHERYGQPYIELGSVWCEDDTFAPVK